MEFWFDLITNRIFIACVLTAIVSQIIKTIINGIKQDKFDLSIFSMPGGMPSSHSAVVVAMTTAIYYEQGVSALAIAAGTMAAIVIYDSLTLRKAVGKQSATINYLAKKLNFRGYKSLKELFGHTTFEVMVGSLLGYLLAYAVYHL